MTETPRGDLPLARRLDHPAASVRRIAALDAMSMPSLDDDSVQHLIGAACAEVDARTRVLLARAVERHAPGRALGGDWLAPLETALAACDEPLGRHALLLARDAVEAARVRE